MILTQYSYTFFFSNSFVSAKKMQLYTTTRNPPGAVINYLHKSRTYDLKTRMISNPVDLPTT